MKSTRRWQQLLLNSLAIIWQRTVFAGGGLFLEPAGSSRAVPPALRWPSGG